MTAAERAILTGVQALTQAYSTRSEFTIDGHSETFTGVISQETFDTDPGAGGRALESILVIVAPAEQFADAAVDLEPGMSVRYQGRRWQIDNMPHRDSVAPVVRIECSNPVRR